MNVYASVLQMTKQLEALKSILEKAEAHADSKKFDSKIWVETRLVADQLPFKKQIQIATDAAKGIAGRLAKKDVPVFEDNEQTLSELKTRVQKTIDYLKSFKDSDFGDYSDVKVPINFRPGKYLTAKEYYEQLALPNFFFHITTAYSILRANGVNLGKNDFLGEISYKDL